MIKAKIVIEYDSTPNEDTWWEAWRRFKKAKKKFESAVSNLDEEGMNEIKEEIKKAWENEKYEIPLKKIDQIFEEYYKRQNR